MSDVISVNPFHCRMWEGHERLEDHITEETCRAEIESFLTHGQQTPVLARPLRNDMNHQYEVVYGARRLFVACHLNMPLALELRELSDREAVIAMDIENRQRKELSPYERGRSYNLWLRNGLFASQEELARAINISASQVSRLSRLAHLPPVIVNAFSSPMDICEVWGRNLMDIWDDAEKKPALTTAARVIAKETVRRPAASVFKRLVSAPAAPQTRLRGVPTEEHDQVVKSDDGMPLFRIRKHRNDTALLFPTNTVSSQVLDEVTREVSKILHRARAKAIDFGAQRPVGLRTTSPLIAAGGRQANSEAPTTAHAAGNKTPHSMSALDRVAAHRRQARRWLRRSRSSRSRNKKNSACTSPGRNVT
jgi:ParB/RepB/Spo0J family partition protein